MFGLIPYVSDKTAPNPISYVLFVMLASAADVRELVNSLVNRMALVEGHVYFPLPFLTTPTTLQITTQFTDAGNATCGKLTCRYETTETGINTELKPVLQEGSIIWFFSTETVLTSVLSSHFTEENSSQA